MIVRSEAREILRRLQIPVGQDFYLLPAGVALELAETAKARGYRKPRNANGSTARYFHALLQRRAQRED